MKAPQKITLSVVGDGRKGLPKSLLIDTAVTRYLVNCGEGTQRILMEHKLVHKTNTMSVSDRKPLVYSIHFSHK